MNILLYLIKIKNKKMKKIALNQIIQKLSKIKKMGYVKSKRNGPTGIGYTLETLLKIKENNIS